jgi:beta-lactamase superfamily II metal-dependent hydrolase
MKKIFISIAIISLALLGCNPENNNIITDASTDSDIDSDMDGDIDGDADGDIINNNNNDSTPLVTINIVNVGQGDSAIISVPNGDFILFDSGLSILNAAYLGSLLWVKKTQFKKLIISHFDADHMGAVDRLICGPDEQPGVAGYDDDNTGTADNRTEEGEYGDPASDDMRPLSVWDRGNALIPTTSEVDEYISSVNSIRETPALGDFIDMGVPGLKIEVVAINGAVIGDPYVPTPTGENDYSIALLLSYGGFHLLLPGDLPDFIEDILAEQLKLRGISIDILHLSHHGSATATSGDTLSDLNPEVAIISVGDSISCGAGFNVFGHPYQSVLDNLSNSTVEYVFQTQEGGANPATNECTPDTGETYPRNYYALNKVISNGDIIISTNGVTYSITAGGQNFAFTADE